MRFVGLTLLLALLAGSNMAFAANETCRKFLWRGAEETSNLSHLTDQERKDRVSGYDFNETAAFLENLVLTLQGERTLKQATEYPRNLYASNFLINHFATVYAERTQFDMYVNTVRQMAEALGLNSSNISRGKLVPPTVSIYEAWQDLFLNLGQVSEENHNLQLLTLTLFLEYALSEEQDHTLAFLDDEFHSVFKNILIQTVQRMTPSREAWQQLVSTVSQLDKSLQLLAQERTQNKVKNPVDESVFKGKSAFSSALQKVDLKNLRTALVKYELVLMPLVNYLVETTMAQPQLAEEMIRRAQQTIRTEFPEIATNDNYVISLSKLPNSSKGTMAFVTAAFDFSRGQGLFSFAAIFKNLPNPDGMPKEVKQSIRDLFKQMGKPQNLPD